MRVLHVGAGGSPLPGWLSDHEELRVDIEPSTCPDVVASMTDLGELGLFETVYCSHALEHLHSFDVSRALGEFWRVLVPGGRVIVIVPDLEDVKPTREVLFKAPGGEVRGIDLYYGMQSMIPQHPYMAHRFGFVKETLEHFLKEAGFAKVVVSRLSWYNLMGVALK